MQDDEGDEGDRGGDVEEGPALRGALGGLEARERFAQAGDLGGALVQVGGGAGVGGGEALGRARGLVVGWGSRGTASRAYFASAHLTPAAVSSIAVVIDFGRSIG